MYRCCSGFLLSLAIISVAALTGCLGKSTGNSATAGVATVTLSPGSTFSMNIGATQVFSASAKNAGGGTVLGINIQFVVTSGTPTTPSNAPAPLSIAANGNSCAGTWDPTVSICSPGTSGIATVYAIASGVFSAPTIVYVHQPIDSIAISMLPPLGPAAAQLSMLFPGTDPALPSQRFQQQYRRHRHRRTDDLDVKQ